jgi:VIT1/CCC1 family predicted Fe2+/Mn2+ transporter
MSITKRLEEARRAFRQRDGQAAAVAHSPEAIAGAYQRRHAERHGAASHQYIGDLVYGGLDGIITTFAVVSGVAGAELGTHVVLILGLANLFADGFSMATGAYLSSKSEQEYYENELAREQWEIEHFPEGERLELYHLYLQQGYTEEDAHKLVEIKTKNPRTWLHSMMVEELGLLPDERKPLLSALATLAAFVTAGSLPLLVYPAGMVIPVPSHLSFPVSLALSALALFGLGAAKVYVTGQNPLRSGLEMLIVGGLAAGVAYAVGALLKGLGT